MHGSIRNCKSIYTCFLEKFYCIQGIGVSGRRRKNMILYSCQNAQFSFYTNASGMRILNNFPGQLNIFLKRKGRTINHNRGISSLNRRHTGIKVSSMIQVEYNWNL